MDLTETKGEGMPDEFHSITVLIVHPRSDLSRLSDETGLEPLRSWRVGDARFTPQGTPLPGTWHDSRWTYVWKFDREGNFEESIRLALGKMLAARTFLKELRASGGRLLLIIRLPGREHQGGEISNEVISLLGEYGFALGIEVFPYGL